MITQIFKLKDLEGQTISEALDDHYKLWLKFTDNSFAVFEPVDKSIGFELDIFSIEIVDTPVSLNSKPLVNLGIITEEQRLEAQVEEERKYEEWKKEFTLSTEERTRKNELAELKRLQDKYKE